MPKIFDGDGNEIADFAISPRQEGILERGDEITVLFHTPQLLRGTLGQHNGSFTLRKVGERIVATDVDNVRTYAEMQKGIRAGLKERM